MTPDELASCIDLTLLNPAASCADIKKSIRDSLKYPFASLCIPPSYVRLAADTLKGRRRIGTVVGFPFGYQSRPVKLYEAMDAVKSGADELDVVMNLSLFKSGEYEPVLDEIASIVRLNKDTTTKLIIETCYLTDKEKILACELAIKSGAHFVKTSTGFGPGGATIDDVALLAGNAKGRIKVKASGGIKDLNTALAMLNAGASRIGTSSGIKIMEEFLLRKGIA